MTRIRKFLMLTVALPLAACGADDVASPGDGVIVIPAPTPTPTTTPTPTPTPTAHAAGCPTGTVDRGVIANRRNCELSGRRNANFQLANLPGPIYSPVGRVAVGTDIGREGAAPGVRAARSDRRRVGTEMDRKARCRRWRDK